MNYIHFFDGPINITFIVQLGHCQEMKFWRFFCVCVDHQPQNRIFFCGIEICTSRLVYMHLCLHDFIAPVNAIKYPLAT